jgi:hypothetical protein
VLGESCQATRVRHDARRAPTLEGLVVGIEYVGRQSEAVEPAHVRLEVLEPLSKRLPGDRIEMVTPQQGRARALRDTDARERKVDPALDPAALLGPEPDFGRSAG